MQDLDSHRIVALIPAYNEACRIANVVRGVIAHLPVLVVDDGSVDDTAALAQAAGARVLRQISNQGKGAALQAGLRQALAHGYDAVLTIDADGQHDPAEIPNFLYVYKPNYTDLIIGVRDFRQMPWPRRFSNSMGRWIFSWVLG
jgi:glycosyltransferase involved in cell wall biosynthesis